MVLTTALYAATSMFAVWLLLGALMYAGSLAGLSYGPVFLALFAGLVLYETRSRRPATPVLPAVLKAFVSAAATLACALILPGLLIDKGVSLWTAFLTGYAALILVFLFRGRPQPRSSAEAGSGAVVTYGSGDSDDSRRWFDGWGAGDSDDSSHGGWFGGDGGGDGGGSSGGGD